MIKSELHPVLKPVNDFDIRMLVTLEQMMKDSELVSALGWYASRAAAYASSMQLRAQVHTPDGVREFYLNEGRRQGVYDMLNIMQAYVKDKKTEQEEKESNSINDSDKEKYGY